MKCFLKRFGFLALGSLLAASSVSAQQPANPPSQDIVAQAAERLHLLQAQVQTLAASTAGDVVRVAADLGGQAVTLELSPFSIRSDDFEVIVIENGVRRTIEAPPPKTMRGAVLEWPLSRVAGTFTNDRFKLRVEDGLGGIWYVQPLDAVLPGLDQSLHAVYAETDVLPVEGVCGADAPARAATGQPQGRAKAAPGPASPGQTSDPAPPPIDRSGTDGGSGDNGLSRVTEISIDSDVEFFNLNGASVAATIDDIDFVMVGVDEIYSRELAMTFVVNRVVVRTTEPDPYESTDPTALVKEFGTEWEDNFSSQARDAAHLMTGKNLDGSIIGLAWIAEICDRRGLPFVCDEFGLDCGAYGLSQSRFSPNPASRFALTAHELGHTYSATHCDGDPDCGIMCSALGGCSGSITTFGVSAKDEISTRRDEACLSDSLCGVFVDVAWSGPEAGTSAQPYNTLREGVWAVEPGCSVSIAPGVYSDSGSIVLLNRPMTLQLWGTGSVFIGP